MIPSLVLGGLMMPSIKGIVLGGLMIPSMAGTSSRIGNVGSCGGVAICVLRIVFRDGPLSLHLCTFQ